MKSFAIRVQKFDGNRAIIKIDGVDTDFALPLQKLPENTEIGSTYTLKIIQPEDEQAEYQKQARALLEAMIN